MRWIGSNENETLRALVVVAVDLNLSLNLLSLEQKKMGASRRVNKRVYPRHGGSLFSSRGEEEV
jgi:hypothetical protein